MLLESIEIKNFRQFMDTTIDFSQNDGSTGKNVTLIMGDNGSGKTTLAQTFLWCLYGETDFSDKVVLNKKVAEKMRPEEEKSVKVELSIKHGNNNYKIVREQLYTKNYNNKLVSKNTRFDIARTDKTGNTEWEKKTECMNVVEGILPQALSKYFFFDGERIEKMSKDISGTKKSDDFAGAVKSLLGLNGMASAIDHFNPRKKNSVIGSYNNSFDLGSNEQLGTFRKDEEGHRQKFEDIENRLEELNEQLEEAKKCKKDKESEIKRYEKAKVLQEKREEINKTISVTKDSISNTYRDITNNFNNNMRYFISMSLIKRALEMLKDQNLTDKDIPAITGDTIRYLLEKGICLCGGKLEKGTEEYKNVEKWLDWLPPRSISTCINEFKSATKDVLKSEYNLFPEMKKNLEKIELYKEEILNKEEELESINRDLGSDDVASKVRKLNNDINLLSDQIKKYTREIVAKNQDKGKEEHILERLNTSINELALSDKKNRKIEIYKMCAEDIYKRLIDEYEKGEKKVRMELQANINKIFKDIYDGGLALTIDEKYHISIFEESYKNSIEASTGQNVAAIFAFITAIIKMARENRESSDESAKLLSSEPYPLVMDAPLSSFDKDRIKSGCEAIPKIADQVVIFIKNTDGELAEQYMGEKIGRKYALNKKDELETSLVEIKQ